MPQEHIEIGGARENSLKNISLRIPKRKITIFTGVSGSGRSSIVFDTIASEAQRHVARQGVAGVASPLDELPPADLIVAALEATRRLADRGPSAG